MSIIETSTELADAVTMGEHKHKITVSESEKGDSKNSFQNNKPVFPLNEDEKTRIPTDATLQSGKGIEQRSTYHIYEEEPFHKCISPAMDPTREKWCGPSPRDQKTKSLQKKERKSSGLPPTEPDDNAFFMHRPYLSFHTPPHVLYMGSSKYSAKPVLLIHEGCLWKKYKLQLGPSISQTGVIDPRGVVTWRHNGGDKKALKADEHKLKGYKVRGWRLWGETGKDYVHAVKANREAGVGPDPDVLEDPRSDQPAVAEEVVYLRWMSPLSLQTRCYHFQYMGIDFYWKGTASVRESRVCGFLLRFNHLKLVARLPVVEGKKQEQKELCLGNYTCSIACKKHGTLVFFDAAILRLVDQYAPSALDMSSDEEESKQDAETGRVLKLKRSRLYQIFIATATCMINSEKEKRHTLMAILAEAGSAGG